MTSICCEVTSLFLPNLHKKYAVIWGQVPKKYSVQEVREPGMRLGLALSLLAVHAVLTLQLEGRGLFTSGDWMVRKVLERLGSCTAIWEGILLKAILVGMRVRARVLLDSVHPLVVQLRGQGRRGHRGHHGGGLQATRGLGRRKGLDDAHRGRVHAAQHLHVAGVEQRQRLKLLIQFLIHTMDQNAERNPEYQGENKDGTDDVIC